MSGTCRQFYPTVVTAQDACKSQVPVNQQQQQWMTNTKMHVACSQERQIPTTTINRKQLVIIDWDDTILPTTALFRVKQAVSPSELEASGRAIYDFLSKLIQMYSANNLWIVTNAISGWCLKSVSLLSRLQQSQQSKSNYWTLIHHLLSSSLSSHIVSSQALYSRLYPNQTTTWKIIAFQQIAFEHFGRDFHGECTLISIGDSSDEFIAAMETKKMLQSQYGTDLVRLVRIRLPERPSIQSMMQQYRVITASINVMNTETERNSVDIDITDFM